MSAVSKRASWVRALAVLTIAAGLLSAGVAHADRFGTIDRVRSSVVAIGTLERTRTPQFQFLGTGFAVGDGSLIVTNAHVVPAVLDPARGERIAVLLPGKTRGAKDKDDGQPGKDIDDVQARDAKQIAIDANADLALLKI